MPQYRTPKGDGFSVPDISTAECPVSLITITNSARWVERWGRMKRMKENGAALHGPDLSQWPARTVDAMETIEIESLRYENAERESIQRSQQ